MRTHLRIRDTRISHFARRAAQRWTCNLPRVLAAPLLSRQQQSQLHRCLDWLFHASKRKVYHRRTQDRRIVLREGVAADACAIRCKDIEVTMLVYRVVLTRLDKDTWVSMLRVYCTRTGAEGRHHGHLLQVVERNRYKAGHNEHTKGLPHHQTIPPFVPCLL